MHYFSEDTLGFSGVRDSNPCKLTCTERQRCYSKGAYSDPVKRIISNNAPLQLHSHFCQVKNALPLELLKDTAIFIGLWRVNETLSWSKFIPAMLNFAFCSQDICMRFLMASSWYINMESVFQLFKQRPLWSVFLLTFLFETTPFLSSSEQLLFIGCINYYLNTRRKHFRDFKLLLIASATIAVLRECLLLS